MGETTLQDSVYLGLSYNNELTNIMDIWVPQLQRRGTEDDVETAERCKDLTKSISNTLEAAYEKADNAKKMTHYIADKAIKDAVSRLATQMRSQNPQNPMVAFVLEHFFSSPQSNDKRKDLEARRIKAKMGLSVLDTSDESQEFAERVEAFEKEAGELALEFAIDDVKKMVDENLRMLAMK
ncbi:hypothetical protein KCU95_g15804, partial [Aureobasidium melanogenum]